VTTREEVCTLVDASDSFDPHSATAAGVDLKRLLWVRCGENPPQGHRGTEDRKSDHRVIDSMTRSPDNSITRLSRYSISRDASPRVEQALRAIDLLLQAGGFGLVAMDLGDIPPQIARRVPLASWFRFRRAVENTATALIVIEQEASAKSCASLVLKTRHSAINTQHLAKTGVIPTHARLLLGLQLQVEVLNSRMLRRKSVRLATTSYESRAAWAG
jgi:recombination protein RecA